jgi:SAM-dependent methyltransferase
MQQDEAAEAEPWEPAWARKLYSRLAPLYDFLRSIWSRSTRSLEADLDELFAQVEASARILELAPGTGINIERLIRCAPGFDSYLGIDISPDMLARARTKARGDPRIELRTGDATGVGDLRGQFDLVVCTYLLSHLDNPAGTVGHAVQKLAPGGTAIFVFVTEPSEAAARWVFDLLRRPFRIRFVDTAAIREVPYLERMTQYAGGLATLAVFRCPESPLAEQERTES